ncbi:hypothetical protein AU194_21445 [Mycobacterium sp. GA-2829]|nr:hypothetical protein AU194_21445 [Mycobacterium sp. GA-2829]
MRVGYRAHSTAELHAVASTQIEIKQNYPGPQISRRDQRFGTTVGDEDRHLLSGKLFGEAIGPARAGRDDENSQC